MRAMSISVLALALAACSPPAQTPTNADPSTPGSPTTDVSTDPLAIAAAPAIGTEIGMPVALTPSVSRTEGDWGWIVAQPWTPEGAAIDWSQTRYAERAAQGVLDGQGTTYVLLKRENSAWRVVEFAVGPTDVAWEGWGREHGAPASLFATN